MNFHDDEAFPRTLYVGNLDSNVSESLVTELFGVIGPVKGCKMIQDATGCDPYCFVEFHDHSTALRAHGAMNQRKILGKEIKVNWATRPAGKRDTSNHHHIFVGDLAPETTSEDLKIYFGKIAEVSDARVMRDLTTNKSKGYGFVSFVQYQDAQDIVEKKKTIPEALHGRQVRCNWAARKGGQTVQKLDYTTVLAQSSSTNCTVYLGGCMSGLSEQLMRESFAGYGNILEVRVFPDKGYAFIRFDNHCDAARSIVAKHGSTLEGYSIKCSWGKEGAAMPNTNMGTGYSNGMGQSMDNMQMSQWSSAGSDMWGAMGQNQQQQYNQWSQWRNQNQQQSPWNTWTPNQMGSSSNPWGAPSQSNTWAPNSSSQSMQQQQNPWGWPTMGGQPTDGWGSNSQQGTGDQMWSNWNSQGLGSLGQNGGNQNSVMSGSGDPGSNTQATNGFGL